MPHINFNVPFLNELGEPIQHVKADPKKIKISQNGQPITSAVLDEEGNAVQEITMVKDLLSRILNMTFDGDAAVPFQDRVKRGKLARKVQAPDSKHYTDKEIEIIMDLTAKAGSTVLLAQLDDLFTGNSEAA